jgi:hypothetical protein
MRDALDALSSGKPAQRFGGSAKSLDIGSGEIRSM